jgi:nickel-dependent lactate racemase
VAIAIEPELPQAAAVLQTLVAAMINSGCSPQQIQVVVAQEQLAGMQAALQAGCQEAWSTQITFVGHDPPDEQQHAYLTATKEGRPLYLQRNLCEADVVIPLGVARSAGLLNELGVHGSWFPQFSNLETQQRFFSAGNVQWETHQRRRREEIEEAAWLLGVHFVVQVLPGPAGAVAEVVCGEATEVARCLQAKTSVVWNWDLETEVDAAVAVLDGPANQQSWRNVAQALQVAARVVREGGSIILWTNITTPPGPALLSLMHDELSAEEQQLILLKLHTADATAAKLISQCLETHRIFLRTELDDASTEDIGLGALHSVQELERLLQEPESCLVIGSAQYANVRLRTG